MIIVRTGYTFNSLFEMHTYVQTGYGTFAVPAFNSLFEMRHGHVFSKCGQLPRRAFNSLFEMHTLMLLCGVSNTFDFQFSI